MALVYVTRRDCAGAEQVLKQACAATPRSVEAATALAHLYVLAGRTGDAEEEFQRALTMAPRDADALRGLAGVKQRTGRKEEAGKLYRTISDLPDTRYKPEALLEGETDPNRIAGLSGG